MKTCRTLLAIAAICVLSNLTIVVASEATYDRQEEIRRAAEKLARYDQEQRQAAKDRADEREQRERYSRLSDGEKAAAELFWIAVIVAIFGGLAVYVIRINAQFSGPKKIPRVKLRPIPLTWEQIEAQKQWAAKNAAQVQRAIEIEKQRRAKLGLSSE